MVSESELGRIVAATSDGFTASILVMMFPMYVCHRALGT